MLPQNWLTMGFGTVVLKSKSKSYLFKLVEWNKVEIGETNFLQQETELEQMLTKFMCHAYGDLEGDTTNIEKLM